MLFVDRLKSHDVVPLQSSVYQDQKGTEVFV